MGHLTELKLKAIVEMGTHTYSRAFEELGVVRLVFPGKALS